MIAVMPVKAARGTLEKQSLPQIAKTLTFASDRYLINVEPRIFAIWDLSTIEHTKARRTINPCDVHLYNVVTHKWTLIAVCAHREKQM